MGAALLRISCFFKFSIYLTQLFKGLSIFPQKQIHSSNASYVQYSNYFNNLLCFAHYTYYIPAYHYTLHPPRLWFSQWGEFSRKYCIFFPRNFSNSSQKVTSLAPIWTYIDLKSNVTQSQIKVSTCRPCRCVSYFLLHEAVNVLHYVTFHGQTTVCVCVSCWWCRDVAPFHQEAVGAEVHNLQIVSSCWVMAPHPCLCVTHT